MENYASVSPFSAFSAALRRLSNTGVHGFDDLLDSARLYKSQIRKFVDEKDARDPDSKHGVQYAYWDGTFSKKPVDANSLPRWQALWTVDGLPRKERVPLVEILILFLFNAQMAGLAFIAIYRYDPR
jgi:hypothetical protein